MKQIFLMAFIFYSQLLFGEYRVFVLKIENSKNQTSKIIKSTLDPQQYKSIYLLNSDETITYVDTWRCLGATRDFTPLCRSPKNQKQIQQTDSQNVQNKS